jgi:hypothetical protein
MIDESAAVLPLWMLISAAFGFMLGEALGGQGRIRKYLEQANDDLREQLQQGRPDESKLSEELSRQSRTLDEIHRYLLPVTKGPEEPTL